MSEIDVKDCCYYNSDNEPYCCELYDNECEAQNCYYKQLQQLKQENEELKKYIDRAGIVGIIKVLKCLDVIEKLQKELCRRCEVTFCGNTVCFEILQKIKEVKEQ